MKLHIAALAVGLALVPAAANAAVTFEYLFDNGFPTSISYDGTAIAGNTVGNYSAFRWTQATGLMDLGRCAACEVGTSGGTPGISADGKRVASTIASSDSQFVTSGLWTLGQGWNQIAPPTPSGGKIVDVTMTDVWGSSPDGNAVVGLFYRNNPGGTAHAYRWRQDTGMVDLGSSGRSSRPGGGATSYNGSVIAGWDESPSFGYRRPCAWRDTTLYQLGSVPDAIGEARAVSTTGEWVVGYEKNADTNTREAARWHWDGSAWTTTQFLGSVDGTGVDQGIAVAEAVSADGKLVIGYNSFYGDPFETTGFIWDETTGTIQDILFWLADQGIDVSPTFDIRDLIAMTPDGRTLIGYGVETTTNTWRAFRIHYDRPGVTGVAPKSPAPVALQLSASPNPARSGTSFTLALPSAGRAEFSLYDASGRRVRTLLASDLPAGTHSVKWDGRDDSGARVGAGVYFTRLQVGASSTGGKLVVIE